MCCNNMKESHLKNYKGWSGATISCLTLILAASLCIVQESKAQSAFSVTPIFSGASTRVNWIPGPQKISVGSYADILVPQGYAWADAQTARVMLESVNDPAPDDLIGVLAENSGKWWAVVEFKPVGYLKGANSETLDAQSILKDVLKVENDRRTSDGVPLVSSLTWESTPVYHAQSHSLSWSIDVNDGSSKGVNQGMAFLGRHGVLQITDVQPYPAADTTSLPTLAGNITFKDGEHYTDYQAGDKLAQLGLAGIVSGQTGENVASTGFGGATAAWIYAGFGLCIVVAGVVLLRKSGRRRHVRAPVRVAAADFVAPSNGAPVPAIATNGKRHHHGRRKKVFDYSKFYTTVMRELSHSSYGPAIAIPNGRTAANGRANGQANGHVKANGQTNGHANGNGANGTYTNGANDALKAEIVELITSQKNLIQEQKCLLDQQTRLIEEKRWLIEEQTAFLKGQAEQQFPLKFE